MALNWLTDAIGTSYLTPTQADFKRSRRKYGGPDDPNVGSYHLDRIHWNKETGTASYSTTDAVADGWVDQGAPAGPDPSTGMRGCRGCS